MNKTIKGRDYILVKSDDTDITKDKVYFLIFHGWGASMNSERNAAIQESRGITEYFKNKSLIVDFIYMQGVNNSEGFSSWNIQNPESKNTWNTGSGYANDTLNICLKGNTSLGCMCEDECNGCQWTHCNDDAQFTSDLIDQIIQDEKKTGRSEETVHFIAVGYSNGAMFVYMLASSPNIIHDYPNLTKIKVFAPVEGNIPFGMFIPQRRENLKMIDFHGYQDTIVPGKSSYIINNTNSEKTPKPIPILSDQSSSTDLQRTRQGETIKCGVGDISQGTQENMLEQLHSWGQAWEENISNISDHYACDRDSRQFVYHSIDDILNKVSGNPRQQSQPIYKEEVFATFPSIKDKSSDRIRFDKYNETVYSVETDSVGHNKAMGYGDIFKMCIDLYLKQGDPKQPGKEPSKEPSKEPGKTSSWLVIAIIVGIVILILIVAGFFLIYKHEHAKEAEILQSMFNQ